MTSESVVISHNSPPRMEPIQGWKTVNFNANFPSWRNITPWARNNSSSYSWILLFFLTLSFAPYIQAENDTGSYFAPLYNTTGEIESSISGIHIFDLKLWDKRGMLIRSSGNNHQCLGNLSYALQNLGELSSAEYAGAAGALGLLPTASAILGAPTKEMWILFRLMPIAGVLSMLLSLGGNLTPTKAEEYDPDTSSDYGGIMPTKFRRRLRKRKMPHDSFAGDDDVNSSARNAALFANQIYDIAHDDEGGGLYGKIWIGVAAQLWLLGVLFIAMWYCQRGSVIPWWCLNWGWMYLWYAVATVSSVVDNVVSPPFHKNYTLRICKAPNNLHISDKASRVINRNGETALQRIENGINTTNRVTIDQYAPSTMSSTCFYAIISINRNSATHAVAKIIAQAYSVAVYAFGTVLFASATLMSAPAAILLLCLVFTAGVFGRVAAMWMASEMNGTSQAICHTVVSSTEEASEHIQKIIELNGLMIEMKGHIIVDGVCILRRSSFACIATYIGLLAGPFDIVGFAKKWTEARRHIHRPRFSRDSGGLMSVSTEGVTSAEPLVESVESRSGERLSSNSQV